MIHYTYIVKDLSPPRLDEKNSSIYDLVAKCQARKSASIKHKVLCYLKCKKVNPVLLKRLILKYRKSLLIEEFLQDSYYFKLSEKIGGDCGD